MAAPQTLYNLVDANKRKTALFIIVISLFLGVLGYAIVNLMDWGIAGYVVFGLFIITYNFVMYYNSDKLALASTGCVPADPNEFRQLHNVVEEVSIAAGVPKPRVYIMPTPGPNAFATGRNPQRASIAVTTGLLEVMNREELQGVVAHEMAHIKNYDILLMTVVAAIGGLIVLLRDFFLRGLLWGRDRKRDSRSGGKAGLIMLVIGLVLAIIAPLFVAMIRAAISRQREYLADASGAYITRYPQGLAQALAKLKASSETVARASQANAHLFISSPFGKDHTDVANWFATHPPIDKRIARLKMIVV